MTYENSWHQSHVRTIWLNVWEWSKPDTLDTKTPTISLNLVSEENLLMQIMLQEVYPLKKHPQSNCTPPHPYCNSRKYQNQWKSIYSMDFIANTMTPCTLVKKPLQHQDTSQPRHPKSPLSDPILYLNPKSTHQYIPTQSYPPTLPILIKTHTTSPNSDQKIINVTN